MNREELMEELFDLAEEIADEHPIPAGILYTLCGCMDEGSEADLASVVNIYVQEKVLQQDRHQEE